MTKLIVMLAAFILLFWALPAFLIAEAWWFSKLYNGEGEDLLDRAVTLVWLFCSLSGSFIVGDLCQ